MDTPFPLGRREEFDDRSREYPVRALLAKPEKVLEPKLWECATVLDQGAVGACVGFAWAAELAAEPDPYPVDNALGFGLYADAQERDAYDDTPPEEGSSVLGGAKGVEAHGWLTEYRWAFGIDDLLDALALLGPAVLGIPWRDSMFDPGADGSLDISGDTVGGHAILTIGWAPIDGHGNPNLEVPIKSRELDEVAVVLHNSWGQWAQGGRAWIRASDLAELLDDDGEACIPTGRVPYPVG